MLIRIILSEYRWYEGKNLLITFYNIIMSSFAACAAVISAIKIIDPSIKL